MQMRFPRNEEQWRASVEQIIGQLETERDRLFKMMPQTPEQTGIALTGPLAPVQFEWGGRGSSSGTPASGTRPASGPAGSGTPA